MEKPLSTADRIGLDGMIFYGYHGVREEERRLGQRFIVDVELSTDLAQAGASDRLEQTLDYGEAHKAVKAIVEGPSHNLLESLAEDIASHLLASLQAQTVRVRVSKPGVPIKGSILDRVWVEIVRGREGAI